MRKSGEKLRLGAFFNPTGHHVASWRHPQSQADAGVNFDHYVEIARTAERAKMDMVFLADNISVREAHPEALARSAQYIANMEPITLLSALAGVTTRIGLVATASTSYNEPYHVARKFASIDHISKGRAGWNLVTSGQAADAYNFSRDEHYEHGIRYERAREFAEVVVGLWDSWDDDAFIRDKESGIFLDPAKMHPLNHKGDWFSVRGPLNVPRTPQGRPVIVQAGGSEDMIRVAAEFAEVIFCAPLDIEPGPRAVRRAQGPDGRARPRARRDEDHAGPFRRRRTDGGGSGREAAPPRRAHAPDRGPRNPVHRARQRRSVRLRDGRADAADRTDQDFQPEHHRSCHGHCPAREPHPAPDRAGRCRRARQVRGARHARAHRGRHGGMVPDRGLRRLQRDAAVPAGRARRLRHARDPRVAAARPVPDRIRGPNAAREPRAEAPGESPSQDRAASRHKSRPPSRTHQRSESPDSISRSMQE